jgi:hypothetical protein
MSGAQPPDGYHGAAGPDQRDVPAPELGQADVDDDHFWVSVDRALATRFQALLNMPISVGQWGPLPPDVASWLELLGSTYARDRLPGLTARSASSATLTAADLRASNSTERRPVGPLQFPT